MRKDSQQRPIPLVTSEATVQVQPYRVQDDPDSRSSCEMIATGKNDDATPPAVQSPQRIAGERGHDADRADPGVLDSCWC